MHEEYVIACRIGGDPCPCCDRPMPAKINIAYGPNSDKDAVQKRFDELTKEVPQYHRYYLVAWDWKHGIHTLKDRGQGGYSTFLMNNDCLGFDELCQKLFDFAQIPF